MENENQKKSAINICSPVFDATTPDIWRFFAATDFEVSEIYNKMFEAGIPIEMQRVGSLLNFAATKNIGSVKTIEPDMYARINARFNNIEFMSQFSKSGYYKIGKPKDSDWNGRNHIKAGTPVSEIESLSDQYQHYLEKYGVPYERVENEFKFPKDQKSLVLKKDAPLKDLVTSGVVEEEDREALLALNKIHVTWRDYCLYMLNTTQDPLKSIWREKMVTSILSWKLSTGSVPDPTLDALEVLSDMPNDHTMKLFDDSWERADYKVSGRLNISGKWVLSISHYPQESLEKEALMVIEDIIKRKDTAMLEMSPKLVALADEWNAKDGKSITGLDAQRNFFGKEERVEYDVVEPIPERYSKKYWSNVSKGANVWFKENIHSTSSWKRFCIAILKNDVSLKYLGFAQTTGERMARANAISAFSEKQVEKEKAKAEAEKLAKKLKKEKEKEI